jgi:hypothetical protein
MLDAARIEQLQRAVAADDWTAAAELCLEIKLKRSDSLDRFRADELAKAVRLRDVDRIEDIIDGLEYPKP